MEFKLEGEEFITLQNLLKVAGLCNTGGAAKTAIQGEQVQVDGQMENRRGRKIRAGQKVSFSGTEITVVE